MKRNLDHRPTGRRRWLLPVLCIPLAAAAAIGTLARGPETGLAGAGIGQALELAPLSELPEWARDAVLDQGLGADYQFVAATLDLNRDEQPEILVAPAPPRADLFIADSPLRVLVHAEGAWTAVEAEVSCRPHGVGYFVTNDWWDLRCRSPRGQHLLRFDGRLYRDALAADG